MKNLAGNKDCDVEIRRELTRCRVPIIEGERSTGEVPASLTGKLRNFTFNRAWYYWVIKGPVPIEVARELYEDPVGATDVRSGGYAGGSPPEEQSQRRWGEDLPDVVELYHIDSEIGLRLFVDTIRKHGLA